ncbi:hypothetical protein V7O62_01955 [Methanolobus sp. ZRKC2]|uniref:hypothetical protein n=1 Tax=Methanolobus sp. ZRKC2 TaxID=3125783 RepID=UPI0032535D79
MIGKYFAHVQKALRTNDPSVLREFKGKKIVDAEGIENGRRWDFLRVLAISIFIFQFNVDENDGCLFDFVFDFNIFYIINSLAMSIKSRILSIKLC